MPRAGKIRPKTISFGSLTTPRQSPVSTITFSTTLVNRPKNPFQSPGTHQRIGAARTSCVVIDSLPVYLLIGTSFRSQTPSLTLHEVNNLLSSSGAFCLRERRQEFRRVADPTE